MMALGTKRYMLVCYWMQAEKKSEVEDSGKQVHETIYFQTIANRKPSFHPKPNYLNEGLWIWTTLLLRQLKGTLSSSAPIPTSNSFKELQQIYSIAFRKFRCHAHIKENEMRL